MRVPLSWLREFAPLPEEATAEQLLETTREVVLGVGIALLGLVSVGTYLLTFAGTHPLINEGQTLGSDEIIATLLHGIARNPGPAGPAPTIATS